MTGDFCLSCKKNMANAEGTAKFLCPKCSKYMVIRCRHCREAATNYRCPECQFQGPN